MSEQVDFFEQYPWLMRYSTAEWGSSSSRSAEQVQGALYWPTSAPPPNGFWPDAGYGEQMELPFWNPVPEEPTCQHDWQSYVGLTEQYEYCGICDQKREKK